jgi:hypothetical protein
MDVSMRVKGLRGATILAVLIGVSVMSTASATEPFSLSASEERERAADLAAETERAQAIKDLVAVPCRRRLKNKKILLLVAEQTSDQLFTNQDRFSSMSRVIDTRLKALGLQTYSPEQIKARIAQAEVDAYFKNDPDAALSASKRLAADYVLKGSISTTAGVNSVVQVNEVAVSIEFTLSAADGRVVSSVDVHSDSYSGVDTLGTALRLVRQQADPVVAQLYNDYCRKAESR